MYGLAGARIGAEIKVIGFFRRRRLRARLEQRLVDLVQEAFHLSSKFLILTAAHACSWSPVDFIRSLKSCVSLISWACCCRLARPSRRISSPRISGVL